MGITVIDLVMFVVYDCTAPRIDASKKTMGLYIGFLI